MHGFRGPENLRPSAHSIVIPRGGRLRLVCTWKAPHLERLAAYAPSETLRYFALVREPENEADSNALQVSDQVGPMGYLHGSVARWLARPLDQILEPVIVEGFVWRGGAYVGIAGRNTVLRFLRGYSAAGAQ
jgi:hypothetical protein